MRVKVGDQWHEARAGLPIAVELTTKDRENIAAMHPDATRYGVFEEVKADSERMRDWLGQ